MSSRSVPRSRVASQGQNSSCASRASSEWLTRSRQRRTILARADDIPVQKPRAAAALEHTPNTLPNKVFRSMRWCAHTVRQRRMTELVFAELHAIDMDPDTRVAVIERIHHGVA